MPYPNYSQPYYPTNYQVPQQPVQTSTDIIWVQGEAGAKAYPVQAGRSVLLMDSESSLFYIKTTDVSGMPQPLRIFSYEELQEGSQKHTDIDTSNFVTRSEFEKAISDIKRNNTYQRKDKSNAKPII